jgi:pseudouridine synthase
VTERVRLHKLLAERGVASLRASERLIAEGRVTVNGRVVSAPGSSALPEDRIEVDGEPVRPKAGPRHLMLNKPPGVLSTASDDRDRRTVVDLADVDERMYPVGRLDMDSEGLVLLTNDGVLAQRLTHPRYGVHKRYEVQVRGKASEGDLRRLLDGVELHDGYSKPLDARVLRRTPSTTTLLLTMGEGRKRQVRRMLHAIGFEVLRLRRIGLGPLKLGNLPPGWTRPLTAGEVAALRAVVGLGGAQKPKQRRR